MEAIGLEFSANRLASLVQCRLIKTQWIGPQPGEWLAADRDTVNRNGDLRTDVHDDRMSAVCQKSRAQSAPWRQGAPALVQFMLTAAADRVDAAGSPCCAHATAPVAGSDGRPFVEERA